MTSGGKKPPSPPAAPTTPVTEPTRSGGDQPGDEREHRAGSGAERRGHAQEGDGADRHQRRLERGHARRGRRPRAKRGDENGNRVQAVGQPAADRPHRHGEHDEARRAQRGVALCRARKAVGQVRGQVDAERDEAAERHRVEERTAATWPDIRSVPASRCGRASTRLRSARSGWSRSSSDGDDGVHDQDDGDEVEREARPERVGELHGGERRDGGAAHARAEDAEGETRAGRAGTRR